ncbi:enoyl-CoA hydratase/isomerase family protein [Ascobolus immersus RN42]|uniref:Enoyl-CoA hydratase/isomerase family protein n=1 Tax=Ascobolus immersus RN42 TaxID=1160509 RepID=A0A3N4HXP0_ASCIM|nr:enoyl-CoA hydratase/isomerase family protein [Ascobolus immersus RN42]
MAAPNTPEFQISFPTPHIAHVEITRPKKLNSFSDSMFTQLGQVFTYLSSPDNLDVRCIVLSGAGPNFTTGLDLQAGLQAAQQDSTKDLFRQNLETQKLIQRWQDDVSAIAKCTKPVIAVMHGYCFGLAIDIASACCIRIASSDAKLSIKEIDIGIAADIGTLSRFPKCVGNLGWVKELAYTGRTFGAAEAEKHGYVQYVEADKESALKKALAVAEQIAGKTPVGIRGVKDVLDYAVDNRVEDGLRYVKVWNGAALQTGDVKEAIMSGMEKRKARYEKL